MRHFLEIWGLSIEDIGRLLQRARELKVKRGQLNVLAGKHFFLIFEKPSTRTRVSFEIAIKELGGQCLFMTPADCQLGRNEPLQDTARVLSRYGHGMIVRTFGQEKLETLARYASIPVINALSDQFHPCQLMSDLLTIFERHQDFSGLRIAWVGDGNNMANSWINAAALLPFVLSLAIPKGYEPDQKVLERARNKGAKINLYHDPRQAVVDADFVNTDVWASMGQEQERQKREAAFAAFQVNEELLALAKPGVKVLHCLPAHRGEEISAGVLEGEQSLVWEQAENRLHMQKAILEWVFAD